MSTEPSAASAPASASRHPARVVAVICIFGIVLTALATWGVRRVDQNAEQRLLQSQTRQAASVLSTAILLIEQPMTMAVKLQSFAGPDGDAATFTQVMSESLGPGNLFVSASLWRRSGADLIEVQALGDQPGLPPDGADMQDFLRHAFETSTTVVTRVAVGAQSRIAYAVADPKTQFVVYAERAIPADRRSPVDRDAAYADLHYAIYFGPRTSLSNLSTTDVEPSTLPLSGLTYTTTVPFGDTVLTLVAEPRRHLGSSLSQLFPLIALLGGLLLTAVAALVARRLVRSRLEAESNTDTITRLYEHVDSLYGEQRALSVRLQRALLPRVNPDIPGLEIASEYVAGAQGIDIGGDWYSIIGIGSDEFAFVVGDVSGRGVDAVAVMAHARFTLRAYLIDGHSPPSALEKCSRQFDITVDGHMTTAVVGVGNWRTGEVTLANAGHPPPLMLTDGRAEFVSIPVGPPLGTGPSSYESVTFNLASESSLVLYTDGLIERRTEDIDVGLRRLASLAEAVSREPLDDLIGRLVSSLRSEDAADDIAVLAVRRVAP